MTSQDQPEVGRGILARGAAVVYRYLVLEILLVATCLPTLVVMVLLGRDASNVPLFAVALLPVAPALSAALGAIRGWHAEPDLSPARPFWQSYRRDFFDVLKWSAPLLVVLALLGFNITHLGAVPGAGFLRPVLVFMAVAVMVLGGLMLVITANFSFRTIDTARLALGLVAGAVVFQFSEAVLLLFAWAFPAVLSPLSQSLVADVTQRFTTHD
jgi:uncharacterized membrane protein YesL